MKKLCIISSLGMVLLAPLAYAANEAATFDQLDGDSNGYLSKSEAGNRADLKKNWKSIDKDGDNQLDITEFSAFESIGRFSPPEDMEEPEIGAAPTK